MKFEKILVPMDFSGHSESALTLGLTIPCALATSLDV